MTKTKYVVYLLYIKIVLGCQFYIKANYLPREKNAIKV